jgi:DNA-directed RNA polymerase subunit RPC12/RpoP
MKFDDEPIHYDSNRPRIPAGTPRWLKQVLKNEWMDRHHPPDVMRNKDGTPKYVQFVCGKCSANNETRPHTVKQFKNAKERTCQCGNRVFYDQKEDC